MAGFPRFATRRDAFAPLAETTVDAPAVMRMPGGIVRTAAPSDTRAQAGHATSVSRRGQMPRVKWLAVTQTLAAGVTTGCSDTDRSGRVSLPAVRIQ